MAELQPILRRGTQLDFDLLYPIYMDKDTNPFLSFEILPKTEFRPIFDELLASGDLYVYELNHQILATCIVTRYKRRAQHVASLGTLATHPDYKGQGIGKQFMHVLIEKLRQDGLKRLDLMAEADNERAIRFYEKLGFKLEGVLKKYFLRADTNDYVDEYLMAKILD